MAQKITKYLITLFFILTGILISCSQDNVEDISKNNSSDIEKIDSGNSSIPGLPPGIPSFPHVFSGKFFISNEQGPDNTKIFAMLGELDSPIVLTKNGSFENLIIGPRVIDDTNHDIEFYILNNDGSKIRAKEVIKFEVTPVIKFNNIDLHF